MFPWRQVRGAAPPDGSGPGGPHRAYARGFPPMFGRFMYPPFAGHPDVDSMDYEDLMQLGNRMGRVNRGATNDEIRTLPTRKLKLSRRTGASAEGAASSPAGDEGGDKLDGTCTVCMEEWADGDDVRTLPCLHHFHTNCIDEWLKRNKTCPICKHDIS